MRVPIPIVIVLAVAVTAGAWLYGTRGMDFMTPRSEARLKEIREKTESSFPRAQEFEDAMAIPTAVADAPPPPAPPPPKPPLDFGDLSQRPALDEYRSQAEQGAPHVMELARALEEKGAFQRALLAWERVLDSTAPDPEEDAVALEAIRRLRPTLPDWNMDSKAALAISLQAGTGKTLAKKLGPILDAAATRLAGASSGIVAAKAKVTAGKTNNPGKGPSPVALWLAGPGKTKPVSTGVLSFTVEDPELLPAEVSKTVYQLVRARLARMPGHTPPGELAAGDDPADALAHRITRLDWRDFALSLAPPDTDRKKE